MFDFCELLMGQEGAREVGRQAKWPGHLSKYLCLRVCLPEIRFIRAGGMCAVSDKVKAECAFLTVGLGLCRGEARRDTSYRIAPRAFTRSFRGHVDDVS